MKCPTLSPISSQTPFALAKGVKAGFWHVKTRLLVSVYGLFLRAVHVGSWFTIFLVNVFPRHADEPCHRAKQSI